MEPPPSVPQRRAPTVCMVTPITTITAATGTPTAIGSARVSTRTIGSELSERDGLRRGYVVATLAPRLSLSRFPRRVPVQRAGVIKGSKDDAKSRDLGSRRWAAVAAAVVAASRSVVRIAARVDLTRPK